jgi:hypothetical protein
LAERLKCSSEAARALAKRLRLPRQLGNGLPKGCQGGDNRVERSLYNRAVGHTFDSVKVFCSKDGVVTKVPIKEHVPPDVAAQIFWLKNRDPAHWRGAWQLERTLGKYVISDQPMSEEQWIRERPKTIDVTPSQEKSNDARAHL